MNELKLRIVTDGKNLGNGILKVDGFINHQVDPALMDTCGKELARRFASVGATKVLTAEISGIAPAVMTAIHLGLPVVYARKSKPVTMPDQIFLTLAPSHTKGRIVELIVSPEYLGPEERVLIIDDFLASGQTIMGLVRLAQAAGCAVYSLDYRLAPENPAPAALDDAFAAFRELRNQFAPKKLIVSGDSAGGGLSLALGFALRDAGEAQPAGYLLLCPWGDLAMQGESIKRNRDSEPMLSRENLALSAEYYAAEQDLTNPSLSPIHGDYRGLAPIYIQAAGKDILLDDARAIAHAAREANVVTKIEVFADMMHVFQIGAEYVPEGQRAVVLAGAWAKSTAS